MILTILVILLLISLLGGGFGYSNWGGYGFGPAGLLIIVLVVLFLMGHRSFHW